MKMTNTTEVSKLQKINKDLFSALIANFWDERKMQFDDFFIYENANKVFGGHTNYLQLFTLILDNFEDEDLNDENNKKFIVAILPLIVEESQGLKTPFGVRSLSVKNSITVKARITYWTSQIWININFLILKKLSEMKILEKFGYLQKEYEFIQKCCCQ